MALFRLAIGTVSIFALEGSAPPPIGRAPEVSPPSLRDLRISGHLGHERMKHVPVTQDSMSPQANIRRVVARDFASARDNYQGFYNMPTCSKAPRELSLATALILCGLCAPGLSRLAAAQPARPAAVQPATLR